MITGTEHEIGRRYFEAARRDRADHDRRRLREHRLDHQCHHVSRRRTGHSSLSRLSDRGAGRAQRFRRNQLPADLRRAAQRKSSSIIFAASLRAAHDAARGNEVVLRRLSARCPSDGDSFERGRRAFDVLSGFARSARSAAGRSFGPSADGQAADDRGLQLTRSRSASRSSIRGTIWITAGTSCI